MEFKSQTFTLADLYNWYKAGELVLQPKFQRRKVWKPIARSYLIDTVFRGLPMPKIYYRMQIDSSSIKSIREVVDGQQRLDAVFSYIDNKFKVSRTHDSLASGKFFRGLPEAIRSAILSYDISADLLIGTDDSQVLQIFARINSYSVTLNAQEKRNAKNFGPFKDLAYKLGTDHVRFWTGNRILTDHNVARMQEAELASELLVALIAGLQDKKGSLDKYYKAYESSFPNRKEVEQKFEKVLAWIEDNLTQAIKGTVFARRALFYSLFVAIADAIYGIEKGKGPFANFPSRPLTDVQKRKFAQVLRRVSDGVRAEKPPRGLTQFVTAAARQTDNIRPRQIRHDYLMNVLKTL